MTDIIDEAVDAVTRAIKEDKNKNYEEALRLYDDTVEYFLHALHNQTRSERAKESMRKKCMIYMERAHTLRDYLKVNVPDEIKEEEEGRGKPWLLALIMGAAILMLVVGASIYFTRRCLKKKMKHRNAVKDPHPEVIELESP